MSLAELPTMSPAPQDEVQTKADNDLPASDTATWQTLMDHTLIDWARYQQPFIDDDLTPPTRKVIGKAIEVARFMKEREAPSPDRVVSDPDGGIVFEMRSGEVIEIIHIWEDETVEYYRLKNGRVVDRRPF